MFENWKSPAFNCFQHRFIKSDGKFTELHWGLLNPTSPDTISYRFLSVWNLCWNWWHLCIESWWVSDTLSSYCGGVGWGVWGWGQRASPTFCGIIYFVLSLFTTLVLDSISQSSVHIKRQFQTTSAWVYSLLIFYLKEWSWRFFLLLLCISSDSLGLTRLI